jgi:hypothetical protein
MFLHENLRFWAHRFAALGFPSLSHPLQIPIQTRSKILSNETLAYAAFVRVLSLLFLASFCFFTTVIIASDQLQSHMFFS